MPEAPIKHSEWASTWFVFRVSANRPVMYHSDVFSSALALLGLFRKITSFKFKFKQLCLSCSCATTLYLFSIYNNILQSYLMTDGYPRCDTHSCTGPFLLFFFFCLLSFFLFLRLCCSPCFQLISNQRLMTDTLRTKAHKTSQPRR